MIDWLRHQNIKPDSVTCGACVCTGESIHVCKLISCDPQSRGCTLLFQWSHSMKFFKVNKHILTCIDVCGHIFSAIRTSVSRWLHILWFRSFFRLPFFHAFFPKLPKCPKYLWSSISFEVFEVLWSGCLTSAGQRAGPQMILLEWVNKINNILKAYSIFSLQLTMSSFV